METDLLILLGTKSNYLRFRRYIKNHVLSKEGLNIFNTLDTYYTRNPTVTAIDWAAFESFFNVHKAAQITADLAPNFRTIFGKLKAGVPTASADDVLGYYVTFDYATQIVDTGLKIKGGKATIDEIGELVKLHDAELGRAINPTDLFVTGSLAATVAAAAGPGLDWRLGELNISAGPLRKGDFVIVAAYVETGKTTFCASEVSHMATQITDTRPVVWVNNEERSDKVKLRIMQAALGLTLSDITADLPKAEAAYEKLMGMKDRILVLNNDSGMDSVEKLTPVFRDLNPALIVFDQLDKVNGLTHREEGEHMRLGRIYKWARSLAHEYGPVIAVSQVDASGEGQQYIRMNQLRGSKVDKPAEADCVITIGKSNDPTLSEQRFIHLPKNKLTGGPRRDDKERHGYFEVDIRADIARYQGHR